MLSILRHLLVFAALLGLWIVLGVTGGHVQLGLGIISGLGVTLVAAHLGLVDAESVPLRLGLRIFRFWGWLAGAILTSAVDVTIRIVKGHTALSPRTANVASAHGSDLLRVIFANSITLTPATVTLSVSDDTLLIHALTEESAADVSHGEMNRRVMELEHWELEHREPEHWSQ